MINVHPIAYAIAAVTLTAIGQICLKFGADVLKDIFSGPLLTFEIIPAVLFNKAIVLGLVFYALSALLWLYVLSVLPLSTAYPFVGLSIVITSLFGAWYFGEQITLVQIVGMFFVAFGILLVAMPPSK